MSVSAFVIRAVFLGLVVSAAVSGPTTASYALEQRAMELPVDKTPLLAITHGGEKRFSIEVADDPVERERGLMYRETMPDDRGMLFVFESSRPVGFWMKNTPMPLDLVFVDDKGKVLGVQPGEPFSEAVISVPQPARFVLELKAGTAKRAGVAEGTQLHHPIIDRIAAEG